MIIADFNSAKTLQETIAKVTAIQEKNATAGAKALVLVVSDDGNETLTASKTLEQTLGAAYDVICATALASINTQLAEAKGAAENDFDALGSS